MSPVTDPPPTWRDSVSLPLQLVNVLLLLLASAVFVWLVMTLPEEIPAHFDRHGNVDRHMSPHELWPLGGLVLFQLLLMWLIIWAVKREPSAVRLVELVTLAMNAAMVVTWLAIPLRALPGLETSVGPAVIGTVVLSSFVVLAAVVVLVPRMRTVPER